MCDFIIPPASLNSNSKILILTDFPSEYDARGGQVLSGTYGFELGQWLKRAGILRGDCVLMTAFTTRPMSGDLKEFVYESRGMMDDDWKMNHGPARCPWEPIATKMYPRPALFLQARERVSNAILQFKPNVVLALGNISQWILTGKGALGKFRGTTNLCSELAPDVAETKCVSTYHPSTVLKVFDLRPIATADCIKCANESTQPDLEFKSRTVFVPESISELDMLVQEYLDGQPLLTFDIETKNKQITCIGFSANDTHSVVIPFYDPRKPCASYWDFKDECLAWRVVARLLASSTRKLTQNGAYDIQYLWRVMGIPTLGVVEDTMFLHHSLYPEMEKSLGFLGSIYANEPAWKEMRPKGEKMDEKADE